MRGLAAGVDDFLVPSVSFFALSGALEAFASALASAFVAAFASAFESALVSSAAFASVDFASASTVDLASVALLFFGGSSTTSLCPGTEREKKALIAWLLIHN